MSLTFPGDHLKVERADCPVCGPSANMPWLTDGKPTVYRRCRNCRSVFASPRGSCESRFAWMEKEWELSEIVLKNEGARVQALAMEAMILKHYRVERNLLDVGCNTGAFFKHFPKPPWFRYGVELSRSAARYAGERYHADVFVGTLGEASFPAAFFDVITFIDMLYYLENPKAELREAVRILKAEGILGIEIPGQAYQLRRSHGLLCWLIERRWSRLHTDSEYIFWPTPGGLHNLLHQSGLRIISWHVIPSPTTSDRLARMISKAYYWPFTLLAKISPRTLNLAPKYFCVAKPSRPLQE